MQELAGQKYGRLTVIKRDIENKGKWICVCDCGNQKNVSTHALTSGNTSSCGCLHREQLIRNNKRLKTKHGLLNTRLYRIWGGMKRRCYEKTHKDYPRYGKRGIKICVEWLNNFKSFYDWAITHGYDDSLTIDRIDNNGGYEPDNCKWSTVKEQNNHRRSTRFITHNNETLNFKQWADRAGIKPSSLRRRIYKLGWSFEKAVTTKARKQ